MKEDWPTRALADVCQITPPKSEVRRQLSGADLVSFVPMEDLGIGNKNLIATQVRPLSEVVGSYTYFADGDVLLAKITPCFENGKLGIAQNLSNGAGFGSSEYIVFRPGSSVTKEWLYYFLSREEFRRDGVKRMSGAVGHKRVSKEYIETHPVPIPPVAEQRRIVAILDEAFEGIGAAVANAEKNLANARELFESYLDSVFARKGEGWVRRRLEDTVEKTCSLSYGIVQPGEDVDGGLSIVRPTDLQTKFIGLPGLKRIDPALAGGYRRTTLHGDELLLCVRGTTGAVSVARPELEGSNVTRGIVPIRFDAAHVNRPFGYYVFISKSVQDQIKAATYGTALMQINIRDLRKISLDLPSLKLQIELVGKLDSLSGEVDRLALIYERKIAALSELNDSILSRAFAGELTARSADALREAAE